MSCPWVYSWTISFFFHMNSSACQPSIYGFWQFVWKLVKVSEKSWLTKSYYSYKPVCCFICCVYVPLLLLCAHMVWLCAFGHILNLTFFLNFLIFRQQSVSTHTFQPSELYPYSLCSACAADPSLRPISCQLCRFPNTFESNIAFGLHAVRLGLLGLQCSFQLRNWYHRQH